MAHRTSWIPILGGVLILVGLAFSLGMSKTLSDHPPLGDPASYPETYPKLRANLIKDFGRLPGLEDLSSHPNAYRRWREYLKQKIVFGLYVAFLGVTLVSRRELGRKIAIGMLGLAFLLTVSDIAKLHSQGVSLALLIFNRITILAGTFFLAFVLWKIGKIGDGSDGK